MQITFTVTEGPLKDRIFTFAGHDTFLVGRSKHAHFRLPPADKWFSRIHFMVEVNPPCCRLMDMDSRNGTKVNGEAVKTADLKDGDVIKAGHTLMRVNILHSDKPAAGRSEPRPTPPLLPAVPLAILVPAASAVRSKPAVQPLLPARPVSESCRVCGASTTRTPQAVSGVSLPDGAWPVCPACQATIDCQPQPIPGYQVIRKIGAGGMGIVYLALRMKDGNLLAIKTIHPAVPGTEAQIERFHREARILSELEHPNIVAFREMGKTEEVLFFAMDFVRGIDATGLLKKTGPMPIPRAVGLVCQLLEALAYAHAKGFVHRDIKPPNLLVAEEKGREVVRLADFGLARVYQASELSGLTVMGEFAGTVPFMAPEQIAHFRDAKPGVDQYAAGATLYNLLTNRFTHDFPRDPKQRLLMILQDKPISILERRPDLPRKLANVIHRALAREPRERFPDVEAMRQALLQFNR